MSFVIINIMSTSIYPPLLGLHPHEERVLSALEVGAYSVSDLVRETKMARMTIYSVLERLTARGMVTFRRDGKRKKWHKADRGMLEDSFGAFLTLFSSTSLPAGAKEIRLRKSASSEFVVFQGIPALVAEYQNMVKLNRHERIYGIQPINSAIACIEKVPGELIAQINQAVKDNEVIVEAVVSDSFVAEYATYLLKSGQPMKEVQKLFEAFGGRMASTVFVPKEWINFNAEIIIFRETVLFITWQDEIAVKITNPDIVGIVKKLFEFAQTVGRRVDQNKLVREFLEKGFIKK